MSKIFVLEDDRHMADLIFKCLEHEKHQVDHAPDGESAKACLKMQSYDLLILDWNVPGFSGVEVCEGYRTAGGISPVLMLTARDQVEDKASALNIGADDYLTKPFHPVELLARVKALLRRPALIVHNVLTVADIELNRETGEVARAGEKIDLVAKELSILELFMRFPNKSFTADALLERIWDSDNPGSVESVRTHIKTLRKKLDRPQWQQLIKTSRGQGYRLETQDGNQ